MHREPSFSPTCSYLPPHYNPHFCSKLNNMPPAHFLFISLHSFILLPSSIVQNEFIFEPLLTPTVSLHPHLSLQLLPSVSSHFVLPCVHFSDLVAHRVSICLHTVFVQFTDTHENAWKQVFRSENQQLPHAPSVHVCVCLSAVCILLWLDYLIVYRFSACLLSLSSV